MTTAMPVCANAVALDKDDEPILFIQVKARPADAKFVRYLTETLRKAQTTIPFAMLVDLDNIQVFAWDGENLSEPLCSLNTTDVLRYYAPDFDGKDTFGYYMTGLTEAWLRDLACHWKSETPPASQEMEATGLLEKLQNGATRSDVEVIRDRIYLLRD
jgi:hypothetical protein